MKDSAERMSDTRYKRKKAGLKEFRFWIKNEDEDFFREILKEYQKILLDNIKYDKNTFKGLKETLNKKLEEYGDWETYFEKVYQMTPNKGNYPSTEKQRKFAYVIARATKTHMPNKFILSSCMLLAEWTSKQINKYDIGYIYNWEEIAEEYNFETK
jgi:hypothetical protein